MNFVARLMPFWTLLALTVGCTTATGPNEELIDLDNDGYYINAPVEADRDCNDGDPNIHPAAIEICNRRDDDCNRLVDDNAEGALIWYPDEDGDGFGAFVDDPITACARPEGYSANRDDCNDSDNRVYPNAPERCNELDDNCNLVADEGIDLSVEWFEDRDRDGYGGGPSVATGCSTNQAWVRNNTDCNDLREAINPAAREICDGFDNNCNGLVDDADPNVLGAATYYIDFDEDGYGNVLGAVRACIQPLGTVRNALDCNDDDPLQNPNTPWFLDNDRDGFGNGAIRWPFLQCWQPIGYAMNTLDCDDNDPRVASTTEWHPDADRDGFGAAAVVGRGCAPQTGWVLSSTDCNDRNPAIRPDAVEVCDLIDNDCDSSIDDDDDGLQGAPLWYRDIDGDTWGVATSAVSRCVRPDGYAARSGDCNDFQPLLHPQTRWWRDADRDGYGDPATPYPTPSCPIVPGHVTNAEDCDDTDYFVHSGTPWYPDADGDGQGVGVIPAAIGCVTPTGLSTTTGDCDDTDPTDVGGFCFGPALGLLKVRMDVDRDGTSQTVNVLCTGQPRFSRQLRFGEADQILTEDLIYPTETMCRVQIVGPSGDASGDGAVNVAWQICGAEGGSLTGVVGVTVSSDPFEITRCSGCMDPLADNFDPAALVDTGACLY